MAIVEVIEEENERQPLPIRVRLASMRDYEELCGLFDELDEVHRIARPDMYRPFPPPARTREQVAHWLAQPESTVLVAQSEEGVVGLAVLLTRAPSGFAGAVPRKVVEVDNLVVRADQRGRRVGRRLLAAAVEWARQRRATHVEVSVHDFNRDAQRFYGNFGFAPSVGRMVLAA
ncbi:MAG TPA: GNAT family N-acetyltransferase [Reyranella sp.]|nr:GNAT family N-acetyltransferase [Reyranella sp.]